MLGNRPGTFTPGDLPRELLSPLWCWGEAAFPRLRPRGFPSSSRPPTRTRPQAPLRFTALRTRLSSGLRLGSLVEERMPVPQLFASVFLAEGGGVSPWPQVMAGRGFPLTCWMGATWSHSWTGAHSQGLGCSGGSRLMPSKSRGGEKGKPLRGRGCSDPPVSLCWGGPKPSPDPGPGQVDTPPSRDHAALSLTLQCEVRSLETDSSPLKETLGASASRAEGPTCQRRWRGGAAGAPCASPPHTGGSSSAGRE